MKTFFVLLLAFAFVMPMPQGMKDDSSEESEESSEDYEDAQLGPESNAAFVVTSSCVVEALDEEGNLDEEKVNTCGKCFEEAEKLGATEESEEAAKVCTIEHLPNFYEDCKDLVESSDDNAQEVLACFMNYVEVFDQTGEIREGVKEELAKEEEEEKEEKEEEEESKESNETSEDLQELETNEDFVVGSACTVEALDQDGNLDEEKLEKCSQCFDKSNTLEEAESIEAATACTVEHLPNVYEECKEAIESPEAPLSEVLECFMDFVEVIDETGEIRQGVKDHLGL